MNSNNSVCKKQIINSENLKNNKDIRINKLKNTKPENIQYKMNNNGKYLNNNNGPKNIYNHIDIINVDNLNELNIKDISKKEINSGNKINCIRFKEDKNEMKPIINTEEELFSDQEKIIDFLKKVEMKSNLSLSAIPQIRKEILFDKDKKNSLNVNDVLQEYNLIDVDNNSHLIPNNNFDSPNMIKNFNKFKSNSKNAPHAIEFNTEKNISNTTFRASSEFNKKN